MAISAEKILDLKSSVNVVPPTDENLLAISRLGYGGFSVKFLGQRKRTFVVGYTAGGNPDSATGLVRASEANRLPYFTVYNEDQLGATNGPLLQAGEELDFSVGSESEKRPFVAVTISIGDPETEVVTGTIIGIYSIFNPTVLLYAYTLGADAAAGQQYLYQVGQQFAGNFSSNGKYLVYQYAVQSSPPTTGDPIAVRTGILRVNKDGTLENVLEIDSSVADEEAGTAPQISQLGIPFVQDCKDKNKYHLVFGLSTLAVSVFAASDAASLETWVFDANSETLVRTGFQEVNQVILGQTIDPKHLDRIVIKTRQVDNGVAVIQTSLPPLADTPAGADELQLYKYDPCVDGEYPDVNALSYLSSSNVNTAGQVQFSHDGKYLAMSSGGRRSLIFQGSFVQFGYPDYWVTLLRFHRSCDTFDWLYDQPASQNVFGLGFSCNDKYLGVAGVENPGSKNVQLYRVISGCDDGNGGKKKREECETCDKCHKKERNGHDNHNNSKKEVKKSVKKDSKVHSKKNSKKHGNSSDDESCGCEH